MPTKKEPATARYRVLRDVAIAAPGEQGYVAGAGDVVELDPDTAAALVRDGMIAAPTEA